MKRDRQESLVLGAVAGIVVGALIFFLLAWARPYGKDYIEAIVGFLGIVVAVAGWYQSTRLGLRSQRELLHLQLLNDARRELIAVFRAEEARLGNLSSTLIQFEFSPEPIESDVRAHVAGKLRAGIVDRRGLDWIFVAEENHALFPELRAARIQLVQRGRKMHEEMSTLALGLMAHGPMQRYLLDAAKRLERNISDQHSLFHDLLVHVQGRALSSVSGHPPEVRNPPDDRVARLVRSGAHLVVDVPDKAARAQLEVAGWLPRPE